MGGSPSDIYTSEPFSSLTHYQRRYICCTVETPSAPAWYRSRSRNEQGVFPASQAPQWGRDLIRTHLILFRRPWVIKGEGGRFLRVWESCGVSNTGRKHPMRVVTVKETVMGRVGTRRRGADIYLETRGGGGRCLRVCAI